MEAPSTNKEDSKSDDSGIMELDTTTTTSTASLSPATTGCKVPRIRTRMQSVFPQQATYNKSAVSMGKKLVKKAIKTCRRMEANQNRRNRHLQLLEQLCRESKDDQCNEETKKEDYKEPPPRPPTRRCMFYREDTDVAKVLRAKQL